MYIAIDFDGTIVEHRYPYIGSPVPNALDVMFEIMKAKHDIILYTMRSNEELQQAVDYCTENGIKLFGINNNPTQSTWTSSPKTYAHIYIDDAALGCPLILQENRRPYVDWKSVREILKNNGII